MVRNNLSILRVKIQVGMVLVTVLFGLLLPSFANAQAQGKTAALSLLDAEPKLSKSSATPTASALILTRPAARKNHDRLLFFGLTTAHIAATEWVEYALHAGSRECQAELNAVGKGYLFGKSPDGKFHGAYPRDREVLIPAASVLAASTVLYLTHHKKAASKILSTYVVGEASVGSAIYWAGCQ